MAPEVVVSTLVKEDKYLKLLRGGEFKGERIDIGGKRAAVRYNHDEGFQINFRLKKRFMSDAHRASFFKSLEWPENNGTIMLQKTVTEDEKHGSFISVSDALDKNRANDMRYLCFICKDYHRLDLIAGTSVVEL